MIRYDDITEILLEVVLNIVTITITLYTLYMYIHKNKNASV